MELIKIVVVDSGLSGGSLKEWHKGLRLFCLTWSNTRAGGTASGMLLPKHLRHKYWLQQPGARGTLKKSNRQKKPGQEETGKEDMWREGF